MTTQLMAVYGTLKQAHGNHRLIAAAGLPFAGKAVSLDAAYTLQGGGFPICRTEGVHKVEVELYEFDSEEAIARIDRLEGHPSWYRREVRQFTTDEGMLVDAWIYLQEPLPAHYTLSTDGITLDNSTGVASWN